VFHGCWSLPRYQAKSSGVTQGKLSIGRVLCVRVSGRRRHHSARQGAESMLTKCRQKTGPASAESRALAELWMGLALQDAHTACSRYVNLRGHPDEKAVFHQTGHMIEPLC